MKIRIPFALKSRIPFVYLIAIIVVLSLALYMLGFMMGWLDPEDTVALLQRYLFAWGIVIAFAILGGIFFGMIFGHRILSMKGFTPLEKGMLEATLQMKDMSNHKSDFREISTLAERIGIIEKKLDLLLESQGVEMDVSVEKTVNGSENVPTPDEEDEKEGVSEKGMAEKGMEKAGS